MAGPTGADGVDATAATAAAGAAGSTGTSGRARSKRDMSGGSSLAASMGATERTGFESRGCTANLADRLAGNHPSKLADQIVFDHVAGDRDGVDDGPGR